MTIENNILTNTLIMSELIILVFELGVISLAVLYFIFSLLVVRQVHLMTETLITEVTPLLRAGAIFHAGLSLGVIILLIGFIFF